MWVTCIRSTVERKGLNLTFITSASVDKYSYPLILGWYQLWKPFLEIWNIACVGKIKWLILCHERWLVTRKGWGCRTGNCAKHGFLSFPVFIPSKNLAASVFSGDLSRRPLVSAHNPHLFPLDIACCPCCRCHRCCCRCPRCCCFCCPCSWACGH